jgi:hypothetical protein
VGKAISGQNYIRDWENSIIIDRGKNNNNSPNIRSRNKYRTAN